LPAAYVNDERAYPPSRREILGWAAPERALKTLKTGRQRARSIALGLGTRRTSTRCIFLILPRRGPTARCTAMPPHSALPLTAAVQAGMSSASLELREGLLPGSGVLHAVPRLRHFRAGLAKVVT
jgi:hypothetical protein